MREIKLHVRAAPSRFESLVPTYMQDIWKGKYQRSKDEGLSTGFEYLPATNTLPLRLQTAAGTDLRAVVQAEYLRLTHPDTPEGVVTLPTVYDMFHTLGHDQGTTPDVTSGSATTIRRKEDIDAAVEAYPWLRSLSFEPTWAGVSAFGLDYRADATTNHVATPLSELSSLDQVMTGGTFTLVVDDDTEITGTHPMRDPLDAATTTYVASSSLSGSRDLALPNFVPNTGTLASVRVSDIIDDDYPVVGGVRIRFGSGEFQTDIFEFVHSGLFCTEATISSGSGWFEFDTTNSRDDTSGGTFLPARDLEVAFEQKVDGAMARGRFVSAAPEDLDVDGWLDRMLPPRFAVGMQVRGIESDDAPYDTEAFTAGVTFALGSIGG